MGASFGEPQNLSLRSNSFDTIAGDPASPWILQVPHSSTRIPEPVRERILLDDDALHAELRAMTDAHTDLLARRISVGSPADGPGPLSTVSQDWSSTQSDFSISVR